MSHCSTTAIFTGGTGAHRFDWTRSQDGQISMLKILANMERPDDGDVQRQLGVRVAYVAQERCWTTHTIFESASVEADRRSSGAGQITRGGADSVWIACRQSLVAGWLELGATRFRNAQRLRLDPDRSVSELSGYAQACRWPKHWLADPIFCCSTSRLTIWMDAIVQAGGVTYRLQGSVVTISHDRAFKPSRDVSLSLTEGNC